MTDFGEGKHVVGRKNHRCGWCYALIPVKERHYNFRGMYDGEWQNWRMHQECYAEFQQSGDDEFLPGDAPVPFPVEQRLAALVEHG